MDSATQECYSTVSLTVVEQYYLLMHIPLLQAKITTNICSIMTWLVYGVVALILCNAFNDVFCEYNCNIYIAVFFS